jgi:FMS-like tyrosine kinase 1
LVIQKRLGIEPDEQFFQRLQEGYRMPKPRYATDAIYQVMQQCWQLEPTERPDFNGLEQSLSAHLDESVREHYLQLDEPHLQANNEQEKNYLEMMKAPNYVNTVEGNQVEYVNVAGIAREERYEL